MKEYYCLANRFCILFETSVIDSVGQYIHSEYADFYTEGSCTKPLIGHVKATDNVVPLIKLKELVKDWLYEDDKFIYVKYNNKYLRISANYKCFEIVYQHDFENNVVFYALELLIRLYAHKFGIDFFHASSFRYDDKVFMLNGFGGSGKTEIMIDFLLKGASFISDDIVIVNEHGEIFPYRVNIPVNWSCISDDFVNHIKVPNYIYKIASYCKARNGRVTRRLYGKLAQKYLLGYYSHTQFTNERVDLIFYNVDKCVWLQEANFSGVFSLTEGQFFRYMNVCLINESRKYFDFDGFMRLKFPFLESFYKALGALRQQICRQLKVYGVAVKGRNYTTTCETLLSL